MIQHHALPTSGVKTPAFPELFGTAEAVPSRDLFVRWISSVDILATTVRIRNRKFLAIVVC